MDKTLRPGAWWLEKETNDVIRIISEKNAYGDPPPEGSVLYQYFTDDANRGFMGQQVIATPEELNEKFSFKSY